jgi:hypothetical protein
MKYFNSESVPILVLLSMAYTGKKRKALAIGGVRFLCLGLFSFFLHAYIANSMGYSCRTEYSVGADAVSLMSKNLGADPPIAPPPYKKSAYDWI